jgi:hypothetical protein
MENKERGFSGEPETTWCTEVNKPDRNMGLLNDFYFIDKDCKTWKAKKGEIIDGASIPRFLWTLVGSPYTRDYRRASIVHDAAVKGLKDAPERKKADIMFYEACREGGCSIFEAWVLYLGVRIGSWMSGKDDDYDEFECLIRDPKMLADNKEGIRSEFVDMVQVLRQYEDEISFETIDKLVDEFHDKLVESRLL